MQCITERDGLELQVVATGMHFSQVHGLTYRDIEAAGFNIDARVEMLLAMDTSIAVTKSMGLGMIGFADAFERLAPDLVLLLGDRFEILAAATATLIARIPLAHVHGGEKTEGAFDEAIRHSITKMAHLHFVAAEEYRNRVIQLGEQPERVFNVGGLGVDAIKRMHLLNRREIEASIGIVLGQRNLLVTYHPVTLEERCDLQQQMQELLAALDALQDTTIIFTMPNADTGSHIIVEYIRQFVASHPAASCHSSLGQLQYLSLLREVDAVVGNSSSGLAEAPAVGTPTVNIGDRQKGRLQAASVVNCCPARHEILKAIERATNTEFRRLAFRGDNPYGDGGAAEKIVDVIARYPLTGILTKSFYDFPAPTLVQKSI